MKWLIGKNIFFGASFLFLLFAIYLAFSWGDSYVISNQPRQLMLKWVTKKLPFSEKQWQSAVNKMHLAVKSTPNNAKYLHDLGKLYEWRAYQKPIWHKEAVKYRTDAIQYFKKALQLRPTWSTAWANLAMSKTLNLKFDQDVFTAIKNALDFGVWEKGVFHKVLWISVANWNALPAELKTQIEAKINETVSPKGHVPAYISQTAKQFKWQNNLQKIINAKIKK